MTLGTNELPDTLVEQVEVLESLLVETACGGSRESSLFPIIRRELLQNEKLKQLLPNFVRVHRSLDAFWPFIKNEFSTYAERRAFIENEFTPIFDELESSHTLPIDKVAHNAFDLLKDDAVQVLWTKALERRESDAEGAITLARTLLETVCKQILDQSPTSDDYTDKMDLPKLYRLTTKVLNLAPSQHSEVAIKSILSGAIGVVNGLGTLRNKLSDSHGRGSKLPVKPASRHAALAINMAGAAATFLVETFNENSKLK